VIAGRSIVAADDPKAAAQRLRSTLDEVWPQ
ncbi:3-keto-L-gulonate-6-phosphate decarboxylase, partial [Salmonella enterica subsp. enterica serovar Typhimurium]|nr:3-keto-L-gulonate-6-phosphate decarboxylase [Salmonella enterica subsp. enterica serovar Typhimurium]